MTRHRLSALARLLLCPLIGLPLAGCSSLSGLIDAHDEFGCGDPPGVRCATLSENFEREEEKMRERERELTPVAALPPVAPGPAALAAEEPQREWPVSAQGALHGPDAAPRGQEGRRVDQRLVDIARGQDLAEPGRSAEQVARLWILPWVDEEGDFHATSEVWVRVREASWRIERERALATRRGTRR